MKKQQFITMTIALCLVMILGAGATLAYVTAQSNTLTNTFAVGSNITAEDIELLETDLDGNPTKAGVEYKNIQAGDILEKDPWVNIKANTADCYVFIKISGLDALGEKGIFVQDWSTEWVLVKANDNAVLDGVYVYKKTGEAQAATVVEENTADQALARLFTKLNVAATATLFDAQSGDPVALTDIKLQACAVQARNVAFDDAKTLYTFTN